MRYVTILLLSSCLYVSSIGAKSEAVFRISTECFGLDKKIVTRELKNAMSYMHNRDKYAIIEVVNFLYGQQEKQILSIGLRGTIFLLCKAGKLLHDYEKYFTERSIYNKLITDIEQKKEELYQCQE